MKIKLLSVFSGGGLILFLLFFIIFAMFMGSNNSSDSKDDTVDSGNFIRPLKKGTVTQPYGKSIIEITGFHTGIDISDPKGTPVYPTADGEVVYAGNNMVIGCGNGVAIHHKVGDKDYVSGYCHLDKIETEKGNKVSVNDEIGTVGETGMATGSHLHFEIEDGSTYDWNRSKFHDPAKLVDIPNTFTDRGSGNHQQMMKRAGINSSDYTYVDYIISHESSWDITATNSSSGAYGLCQALPPSKMETAGKDWKTNGTTQLKWCSSYAKSRYGNWKKAYDYWKKNHWW